jgi:hypothetical protein
VSTWDQPYPARGSWRHEDLAVQYLSVRGWLLNVTVPGPAGPTVAEKVIFCITVLGLREDVTVVTGVGGAALITDTVPPLLLAT